MATNPNQFTLCGCRTSGHVLGLFKTLSTSPHALTTWFEKQEVLDSFGVKIPLVFALTVVCGQFSSKLAYLEIFCSRQDRTNPIPEQFIFVLLAHYLKISWTSLLKLDSPNSRVSSAHIAKTFDRIVPRPFPVINRVSSKMVWRLQKLIPTCYSFNELLEASIGLANKMYENARAI